MTIDPANDGNPNWSHDGRWIYFDSARAGEQQVFKIPANGGEAIQVTREGGFAPLESPDGKSLYYVRSNLPAGRGHTGEELDSMTKVPSAKIIKNRPLQVPENTGQRREFLGA
ncbi:MAG: hypothetical protein DMG57_27035 [Acidobacteria bacterium]|nr:MAG: hypothetical protein DMG57_27035 [Acidobacteriota bacterium]